MPRLRFRDTRSPSTLEDRFLMLWQLAKGPPLEREFRFHAERGWRADFAHLPSRTLIEVEGGIWIQGRHNRAAGFNADLEKYLEAGLLGWRVFRLGPDQITRENVVRLVDLITEELDEWLQIKPGPCEIAAEVCRERAERAASGHCK
jgi:very-short-patch-repair endonuclease